MDSENQMTLTISAAVSFTLIALFFCVRSCEIDTTNRTLEGKKLETGVVTACINAGNPPHECERLVSK